MSTVVREFKKRPDFEINACTLGINSEDWYHCAPGMVQQNVLKTMLEKGYEVAPIINKKGVVTSYFRLISDQEKLINHKINEAPKIYYLTHVVDLIRQMLREEETHYFLTDMRDASENIVGLLSLSNFNNRLFYMYLFNMISEVEIKLSRVIADIKEEEAFRILDIAYKGSSSMKQLAEIKSRLHEDRKGGVDTSYHDYLYLSNFFTIVSSKERHTELGYKSPNEMIRGTSHLKNIRNIVAHPVKSLISNFDDLKELGIALDKLYELNYSSN